MCTSISKTDVPYQNIEIYATEFLIFAVSKIILTNVFNSGLSLSSLVCFYKGCLDSTFQQHFFPDVLLLMKNIMLGEKNILNTSIGSLLLQSSSKNKILWWRERLTANCSFVAANYRVSGCRPRFPHHRLKLLSVRLPNQLQYCMHIIESNSESQKSTAACLCPCFVCRVRVQTQKNCAPACSRCSTKQNVEGDSGPRHRAEDGSRPGIAELGS